MAYSIYMTVKNEELINEVVNTYTKTGYGYRRLATYIMETRGVKVSHQTIKRWLQSAGVKAKEPKQVKYGSRAFYKQEYNKLLKRVETLEQENMELKEALEKLSNIEAKVEGFEKAQERDKKVIDMLYQEVIKNCNKDTRVRISDAYTKAYGLDKARRAQIKE